MSVTVSICRDWTDGPHGDPGQTSEVDNLPIKVILLDQADKSDPLDQLLVLGFKAGKFSAGVTLKKPDPAVLLKAISAILGVAVDHAAAIRDALAEERENGKA